MANKEVRVLVGTRKGGFLFRSDLRRKGLEDRRTVFPRRRSHPPYHRSAQRKDVGGIAERLVGHRHPG